MQHVTNGIYPLAFSSPSFKPRSIVCTVRPAFPPAKNVCSLLLNDLKTVPENMNYFSRAKEKTKPKLADFQIK